MNIQNFVIESKDEAELVVKRLNEIIDQYGIAYPSDLYDLIGFPTTYKDNEWYWKDLTNVNIRQIQNGYLIDLPPLEAV